MRYWWSIPPLHGQGRAPSVAIQPNGATDCCAAAPGLVARAGEPGGRPFYLPAQYVRGLCRPSATPTPAPPPPAPPGPCSSGTARL